MTTVVVDLTVAAIGARCDARTYRGPAAVYVDTWDPVPGGIRYGDDAVAAAGRRPRRVEPYPLAWIDDAALVLAGRLVAVDDLVTGLLRDGVGRVCPSGADLLVLTVPSHWGSRRRARLRSCAEGVAPRLVLVETAVAVWAGSGPGGDRAVVLESGPLGSATTLVAGGRVRGCALDAELLPQDLDRPDGAARAADLVGAVVEGDWAVSEVLVAGTAPESLQFEWALRERGLTGVVDVAAPDAALRGAERVGPDVAQVEAGAEAAANRAGVVDPAVERARVDVRPGPPPAEADADGPPAPRRASGRKLAALAAALLVIAVAGAWLIWPRSNDAVTAEPAVTEVPTATAQTPIRGSSAVPLPSTVQGSSAARPSPSPSTSTPQARTVTDHRVSLQVPKSWWETDREAVGRGSRVRVEGPDGSRLMLVQNPVAYGAGQDEVAAQLRRTIADRGPTSFDGFDPYAEYAGRDVIAYREHTASGSTVHWRVLVLDGLQISVGCEPSEMHPDRVADVCDQAIRTLHVNPA
ncbi:type VII secretion-associated protein [Rhodococcus sp. D2-41]|uniref:Type VII secretion-associated protein n=1 Tax=Speluncibacter jeojiensis TaxID=2710754 RepID=A0A9X4M049_9ACTN|nr:type VII secretion-associated protein [Rhodococcus sp. D2-41]MDG3008993.1 type VII secretion-associated protein [Rhodococcus sp. D2-41]MDG3015504.1 type VII secretion-associated protein [Corynebacteriales bacterium D3-21]